MNNIENIGLKYTVDVNNQITNNITQKLKNAKAENVFANPLLKSLNALLIGVVLAINIVLLRAKF